MRTLGRSLLITMAIHLLSWSPLCYQPLSPNQSVQVSVCVCKASHCTHVLCTLSPNLSVQCVCEASHCTHVLCTLSPNLSVHVSVRPLTVPMTFCFPCR